MSNKFAALKVLRQELYDTDTDVAELQTSEKSLQIVPTAIDEHLPDPDFPQVQQTSLKRPVGRPPGRRSDPEYTQISAYIPLELLQEVQDALSLERRRLKKRTPRPVSDLIEELLGEWLKNRIQ